jgi:hypothetical protein
VAFCKAENRIAETSGTDGNKLSQPPQPPPFQSKPDVHIATLFQQLSPTSSLLKLLQVATLLLPVITMQRLQRKAGQLLHRSPDDAEVGLLLTDFENGDKLLTTVSAALLTFRNPQSCRNSSLACV